MTKIDSKTCEKNKRKMLRSNMPKAKIVLWSKLKNKAVDGDSHFSEVSEVFDKERQDFIESFGIFFYDLRIKKFTEI
jgi:very-short-patch-repair endonuclease